METHDLVFEPDRLKVAKGLSSAFCLAVCLFEGNQGTLSLKLKMDNPKNFMKIFSFVQALQALLLILFCLLSNLAFGSDLKSPVTTSLSSSTVSQS